MTEQPQTTADISPKKRVNWIPILSFIAGIGGTLLTQSFISQQQSAHARRETRVAALKDYASACERDAISFSRLANLPMHSTSITELPISRQARLEKMYQMLSEAREDARKTTADLAVQTQVVNALFETQVDPIEASMKDIPPEYKNMPGQGQTDAQKLLD